MNSAGYENIKRIKINEYTILNENNSNAIADSIHNCIAVLLNRRNSKILCHLNNSMIGYEDALNEIFGLDDDIIIDATIYMGNDSTNELINDCLSKLSQRKIPCKVTKAYYNPFYDEGSVGFDYNNNKLLYYDLFTYSIDEFENLEYKDNYLKK